MNRADKQGWERRRTMVYMSSCRKPDRSSAPSDGRTALWYLPHPRTRSISLLPLLAW